MVLQFLASLSDSSATRNPLSPARNPWLPAYFFLKVDVFKHLLQKSRYIFHLFLKKKKYPACNAFPELGTRAGNLHSGFA